MALNFPANPVQNQVYTAEGVSFVWNGVLWAVLDPFPWATNAEALAGTNDARPMQPANLRAVLNAIPAAPAHVFGAPTAIARAHGVNYQNTFGRPLMVAVSFWDRDSNCEAEARIGAANSGTLALNVGRMAAIRGSDNSIIFVVPTAWWFRLNGVTNRAAATAWWEWRGSNQ